MFDILIRNAKIVDGSGSPWFYGDIAIVRDRIVDIAAHLEGDAHCVIEANGKVVSPGFIDMHCHDDMVQLVDEAMIAKTFQGVTTVVTGNCGFSTFPTVSERSALALAHLATVSGDVTEEALDPSFSAYQARISRQGSLTNVAGLVGFGSIRVAVMGFEKRQPTASELMAMENLVIDSINQGAVGFSLGLLYVPDSYADTAELMALCKAVASKGGLVTCHVRTYETHLIESAQEFLDILAQSGARGQLSHLQAGGRSNWGKVNDVLHMMTEAREKGIDITCDMYPYVAGSTSLSTLFPPWTQEQGGVKRLTELLQDVSAREKIRQETVHGGTGKLWEPKVPLIGWGGIVVASVVNENLKACEGKSLAEIGTVEGRDPFDVLVDLVCLDEGRSTGIMFSFDPKDIEAVYASPLHMVCSDGMWTFQGKPHPRHFGAFARVIRMFVQEKPILTLEDAIRKMTSMPAQRLGLMHTGLLRAGMRADICIFNPTEVKDKATFDEPRQLSQGFSHVIVNGKLVLRDGELTGKRPGKVLTCMLP